MRSLDNKQEKWELLIYRTKIWPSWYHWNPLGGICMIRIQKSELITCLGRGVSWNGIIFVRHGGLKGCYLQHACCLLLNDECLTGWLLSSSPIKCEINSYQESSLCDSSWHFQSFPRTVSLILKNLPKVPPKLSSLQSHADWDHHLGRKYEKTTEMKSCSSTQEITLIF